MENTNSSAETNHTLKQLYIVKLLETKNYAAKTILLIVSIL